MIERCIVESLAKSKLGFDNRSEFVTDNLNITNRRCSLRTLSFMLTMFQNERRNLFEKEEQNGRASTVEGFEMNSMNFFCCLSVERDRGGMLGT